MVLPAAPPRVVPPSEPAIEWLGRVDYGDMLERQRRRQSEVASGHAAEVIWLLEHPAVITTGRRDVHDLDRTAMKGRGIAIFETERGGLATWHGPGQLVGYPILDLGRRGIGVKSYVSRLEAGLCRWLGGRGIAAAPRDGFPGVWVGNAKIAAIGINVRRGVSMHGFALNLCPDLNAFRAFTPCGLDWAEVTSVAAQTGAEVQPADAADPVGQAIRAAVSDSDLLAEQH
jgi:lipoyl(octanoyl) transferase